MYLFNNCKKGQSLLLLDHFLPPFKSEVKIEVDSGFSGVMPGRGLKKKGVENGQFEKFVYYTILKQGKVWLR